MINMYVKVDGSQFYIDIPEYSSYLEYMYIEVITKNEC